MAMEGEGTSSIEEPATEHRGWKTMPYIIGNETFEKLGTIGTSSNLLVYLTTVFHMESVRATTLNNFFHGTTSLAPIFGAFLSDTYLGRYWTIGFASMASLVGMLILTLTAGISGLHPPPCDQNQQCAGHTRWQLAVLLTSFAFLVIGAGGIRPCNLAFGADQFNPRTQSGKKGINSFFNWYFFTIAFAVMVSSTVIVYVQSNVSWTLGLALPMAFMLLSCAFFFMGTKIYVIVKPEGSPFTSIAQVVVAAFRKRRLKHPNDPKKSVFDPPHLSTLNSKLPYTEQFRFLDKASLIEAGDNIKSNGSTAEIPWRLCTMQQVEEVKCLLRIIPVWSSCLIFNIGMSQVMSYVVFQALQFDRHLGKSSFEIPAGSFSIFAVFATTVWIPLYDRVIVPLLQRYTGKEGGITLLQRMGIGLVLSILALAVSAFIEVKRRNNAFEVGGAISSLSGLWLIPQLTVIGIAEAFNMIGQTEFYYKQFPESMRSIAGSMLSCSFAISSYLSGFMVTVVHSMTGRDGKENWLAQDLNEGRLDYFYLLLAAMGAVNFVYFIVCANWYRYKVLDGSPEVALNTSEARSPA